MRFLLLAAFLCVAHTALYAMDNNETVNSKIIKVSDIPRTISGKIVELAVNKVIHGREVKNTDALANPEALNLFKNLSELQT